MRSRTAVLICAASAASLLVVACSFGVDLDNLFDGNGATGDGGPADATPDGANGNDGASPGQDAAIPKVKVVELQAGTDFACARRVDGTVMCWGFNDSYGQLGTGAMVSSSTPVLVTGMSDTVSLSVGQIHACAAHATGSVSCWGYNQDRELGDGTKNNTSTPVTVLQLSDATSVSVGSSFSCAIRKDGTVSCWGDDTSGQLGDGLMATRSQPAPVTGVANAMQLASADSTTCALVKGGDVYCWGANDAGQAGVASPMQVLTPLKVAGLSGVTAIAAGSNANHFCAVESSGAVQCWGQGNNGQLGNGDTNNSSTPVNVTSVNDAVGVTGGSGFTCATRKSGAVNCWGQNNWRQLGVGDTSPPAGTTTPLPVNGISNAVLAGAGNAFVCAVQSAGNNVSCWGSNYSGSLGRGTRVRSATPIPVTITGKNTAIGAGNQFACAVGASGGVSCWGENYDQQLGNSTISGSGTPIVVAGLSAESAVAAGSVHACAFSTSTQSAQCWGFGNSGDLGNGSTPYTQLPPVAFLATPAVSVGAGNGFTCVLLANGAVSCAGVNYNGEVGRPGGSQYDTPQMVEIADAGPIPDGGDGGGGPAYFGAATKLTVGQSHVCAIHNGGTLACWGYCNSGECGTSTYAQPTAFDVTLPNLATDVACGGAHTCAVLKETDRFVVSARTIAGSSAAPATTALRFVHQASPAKRRRESSRATPIAAR